MIPSVPAGEVRHLGDRAFLIGVADAPAARRLAGALTGALAGNVDVVCGAATVMVHATEADAELEPVLATAEAVWTGLARGDPSADAVGPGRLVTIPCFLTAPTSSRWPRWPAADRTRCRRS